MLALNSQTPLFRTRKLSPFSSCFLFASGALRQPGRFFAHCPIPHMGQKPTQAIPGENLDFTVIAKRRGKRALRCSGKATLQVKSGSVARESVGGRARRGDEWGTEARICPPEASFPRRLLSVRAFFGAPLPSSTLCHVHESWGLRLPPAAFPPQFVGRAAFW